MTTKHDRTTMFRERRHTKPIFQKFQSYIITCLEMLSDFYSIVQCDSCVRMSANDKTNAQRWLNFTRYLTQTRKKDPTLTIKIDNKKNNNQQLFIYLWTRPTANAFGQVGVVQFFILVELPQGSEEPLLLAPRPMWHPLRFRSSFRSMLQTGICFRSFPRRWFHFVARVKRKKRQNKQKANYIFKNKIKLNRYISKDPPMKLYKFTHSRLTNVDACFPLNFYFPYEISKVKASLKYSSPI